MGRRLPLALAILLSVFSAQALAIGMESPRLHSNLNQPLNARIGLIDTGGLDASLIKARVPDAAAFTRAGIDRSYISDDVRVAVKQQGGRHYLQLTTSGAVREPYVDMLLDVEWPNGKLQRQVTLLFDPAGYSSQPALVSAAEARSRPLTAGDSISPRSVALRDDARSRQTPSSSSGSRAFAGGSASSIKVRSGDSLWTIARRVRPDASVSIRQAMLAIQEANSEAFPGGNINRLRTGVVLSVPDHSTMLDRTRREADRQIRQQYQKWVAEAQGKTIPAPAEKKVAAASFDGRRAAASTVEAATASAAARTGLATAGADGKPRLPLLDEAASSASTAAASANVSSRGQQAIDELSDRLESLEDQLLTNQQRLNQLEQERDDLRSEVASLRSEVVGLRASLAERTEQLETARLLLANQNRLLVNSGVSPLALPESLIAVGVNVGQPRDGEGNLILPSQPWPQAIWKWLQDNMAIVSGVIGALLLLLLLWIRRCSGPKGEGGMSFAGAVDGKEDPDRSDAGSSVMRFTAAATPAQDIHHVNDDIAAQGQVSRGMEPPSQPEAAAISEADIFIAYGRFDQARALLKSGLAEAPSRQDLRLKLMRVHGELGNLDDLHAESEQVLGNGNEEERQEAVLLLNRYDGMGSPLRSVAASGGHQTTRKASHLSGVISQLPSSSASSVSGQDEHREDARLKDAFETAAEESLGKASASPRVPVEDAVAFEPGLKGVVKPSSAQNISNFSDNVIDYQAPELTPGAVSYSASTEATKVGKRHLDSDRPENEEQGRSIEFDALPEKEAMFDIDSSSSAPRDSAEWDDELPPLDSTTLEEVDVPHRDISDFEFEEVAFGSGDQDNASFSAQMAEAGAGAPHARAFQQLEQARQLLVDGDDAQAAKQLEALATTNDDMVREEALALMERFGLT